MRLLRAAALRPLSALASFCRSGGEDSAITTDLSYAYARTTHGYLAAMLQAAGKSGKGALAAALPGARFRCGKSGRESAHAPLTARPARLRGAPTQCPVV